MKFVLVLLGIVALAAAAPQPRILDYVQGLVTSLVDTVYSTIDQIMYEVKSFTSSYVSRGNSITSAALSTVNTLTSEVQTQINDLIARGGSARTCALAQMAQLTEIGTNAISKVNGCANDITNAIAFFESDIGNRVQTLKNDVNGLIGLVSNCFNDIFNVVTCAISSVNKGYVLVNEFTSTVYGAIDTTKATFDGTVVKAQTCATATVDMVKMQVQQIAANVVRCI